MDAFWFFITMLCLVTAVSSKSCLAVKLENEINCQKGDLDNYVDCVKNRMKRHSTGCKYDDQCFDCDCEFCQYSQCGGQCNDCCNSCCTDYVQCHTNHCCHKQCHSECRTYNCRSSCRKSCYESISRETEKEVEREVENIVDRTRVANGGANNNNNNKLQSNTSNANTHNITTVINLKNVINNTNLIDVPINLNYTNRNNISLTETTNPQGCRSGSLSSDNCCIVIGPKQCFKIRISPYVRCFFLRSRQCGSICTSTVMHEVFSSSAFGQSNFQGRPFYIPQPQPRCSYTSKWPYVACGVQSPSSCEGCYGHYFNSQINEYKSCPSQCYDDFGAGPLYRQGPFYQPTYSHTPPCYLSPQGCGGLGGFGAMGEGGNGGYQMMGTYGGGLGGYMGGLGPGFDGGFGYAAQQPMMQPGLSFLPELVPKYPQLPDKPINWTTTNQTFVNSSELLGGMIIDQYQADGVGSFVPIYELPDQEVTIDVNIKEPNKTQYFQWPFIRNVQKKENEIQKGSVVMV